MPPFFISFSGTNPYAALKPANGNNAEEKNKPRPRPVLKAVEEPVASAQQAPRFLQQQQQQHMTVVQVGHGRVYSSDTVFESTPAHPVPVEQQPAPRVEETVRMEPRLQQQQQRPQQMLQMQHKGHQL